MSAGVSVTLCQTPSAFCTCQLTSLDPALGWRTNLFRFEASHPDWFHTAPSLRAHSSTVTLLGSRDLLRGTRTKSLLPSNRAAVFGSPPNAPFSPNVTPPL